MSEKVLDRFLNQSVDEYLASPERDQHEEASAPLPDSNIAMMFIDRKIDMVTPMVTPLTYEGLLDEVVGIDAGYVSIEIVGPSHADFCTFLTKLKCKCDSCLSVSDSSTSMST